MKNIQTISLRGGSNIIDSLQLIIDDSPISIPFQNKTNEQFNIRCVLEIASETLTYPSNLFGEEVYAQTIETTDIHKESTLILQNEHSDLHQQINLDFEKGSYTIGAKVFIDRPLHAYKSLEALPLPTNLITIYIYFYDSASKINHTEDATIQKIFDGYSHLGFFLADLPKMKQIIHETYGNKELDLVDEFSNTEIIDTLFEKKVIMIAWGINPYTYPIISSEKIEILKPILGKEFSQEGIYNIDESINELSLVPGHELRNWPHFLETNWPKVTLFGTGTKTYLKPFYFEDQDQETTFSSFLIYRAHGEVKEATPLMNIDLLYSN